MVLLEDKSLKLTARQKEICQSLGLESVDDVLTFYPIRYDMISVSDYEEWKIKDHVTFEGKVCSPPRSFRKGRLVTSSFEVMFQDRILKVTIFNRPWVSSLRAEDTVTVQGIYQGKGRVTATGFDKKPLQEHPAVTPVYSSREGLRQSSIRNIVKKVFEASENQIMDDVPESLIHRYRLLRKRDALYRIHFPSSAKDVSSAARTLKYSEFLHFFTGILYMKQETAVSRFKPVRMFDRKKIEDKICSLPFRLTSGQKEALDRILDDMASNRPMYRLVQGDVGCGKTVVAILAMYACVLAGYQAAFLAPTEILARQHLKSIQNILSDDVQAAVLYSGMNRKEKQKLLEELAEGKIQIIAGTHALLQDSVTFARLGLVITDEQQRFGVEQRKALLKKTDVCDFLLMSATPIPRTLAAGMFGEMNVSTIRTLPEGRKEPVTELINENSFRSVLEEVKKLLAEGYQLYIICAAVEEGETDIRNVETVAANIRKLFPHYQVGTLIGPMKSDEKDRVMQDFQNRKTQILVSTTVVEVGMNVVNATGMIVYNADRFGLSQLHQLRGRIQRGNAVGHCWLLTDSKEEKTLARLNVLVHSNDGFAIALEDLRQRGPGDILGVRQSGIPDLVIGSFSDDTRIIDTARKDAEEILSHPDNPEYAGILDEISTHYQKNYVD